MKLAFASVFALGVFLSGASAALAQVPVPDELLGHWGTDAQCEAQRDVGPESTVEHVLDAPYFFNPQWVARWNHYCRVMRIFPLGEGAHRAMVICGEDAVDRPWELEITNDDAGLTLTWRSMDRDGAFSEPWVSGPYKRCEFPQS